MDFLYIPVHSLRLLVTTEVLLLLILVTLLILPLSLSVYLGFSVNNCVDENFAFVQQRIKTLHF